MKARMKIHPSAIIHPDAQIAADVEIGPYACIEGPAVIDSGTVIHSHAILAGSVRLGKNNQIGHGAIIGTAPQALSFRPETRSEVVIGDSNIIREYCTIHRSMSEGGVTRLGDSNFLMTGCHVGHDSQLGSHVIIANNVLLGGHVEVQDRAFLGGGAVFHQHVRVGQLAVVQGNTALSKDVPPFMIAAVNNTVYGLNVVGLRRAGMDAAKRQEIKEACHLLFTSGYNTTQAIEHSLKRTWSAEAMVFFDFVSARTRRGLCAFRTGGHPVAG